MNRSQIPLRPCPWTGRATACPWRVSTLAALLLLSLAFSARGEDRRLRGLRGELVVADAPLSLTLVSSDGRERVRTLAGGFSWVAANGARHAVGGALRAAQEGDALALVLSSERGEASLRARWLGARTLELRFRPPASESVRSIELRLALAPGEAIWGLTERIADSWSLPIPEQAALIDLVPREVGGLDRRGETVAMWVVPTVSVYAPLYTSSRGYGLLVDGTWPGEFDVGDDDEAVLRLRFETGEPAELRVFVFLGGPREVIDAYTELIGRPQRPPDWALRHWIWHDEHSVAEPVVEGGVAMNKEVAEDLRWHERLGLPAGVYLFDRPWTPGAFGFDTLSGFDERRFPNARAMLAKLAEGGWQAMVWSATFAMEGSELGAHARERGFLAPGSDRVLDLTNAEARAYWKREHVAFLKSHGVHGIKLDRGEERIPSRREDRWADGRSGRELRNAYPTLQLALYAEILREAWGEDFLLAARASYTGGQQYGAVWAGDLPGTDLGLRAAIIGMLRAGFLGHPFWGSDVGGYYAFADREVFARWLEFGALSPLFEIGGIGSRWPWAMPSEPAHDEELIAIYRDAIRLRHALLPYLAKHADIAARTGLPVARAMAFDYPDDPRFHDVWDQYLLGDDLLVAPVWRVGERERDVLLPPGAWLDYWNRQSRYEGPSLIRVGAPLDRIPVLVRAGAELPASPAR